jgi:hypothetical protein
VLEHGLELADSKGGRAQMAEDDAYFVASRDCEVSVTTTGGASRTLRFEKDAPVAVGDPHVVASLEPVQRVRSVSLEKAAELGHSGAQAIVAKRDAEAKAAAEAEAAEAKAKADAEKAASAGDTSSSSSASSAEKGASK